MVLRRNSFIVGATIAAAGLVRVYEVFRFPFEQDEIYTIDEAAYLFHTHLFPGIQARPVFFLLEHPLVTSLSTAAPTLRLLALIFGIAGLWITWLFARQLAGKRAAYAALVLVAICPWHLYASGFARYYSLLYLLAALVYWRLPLAYDSDRPTDYLATLVPLLVGGWTHPSFIFPVLGAVLAVTTVKADGDLTWRWPTRRGWLYLWLPFLLLSAVVFLLIKLVHPNSSPGNGGALGIMATLRLIPAMIDWTTVPLTMASIIGTVLLLRSDRPGWRRFGVMALLGTVATLVALFVLSFRTAIYADYGIAALPLAIMAAAAGLEWIADQAPTARRTTVAAASLAIVAVSMLPSAASHLSDGTRFDYRSAFARVRSISPSTHVMTWPIALQRTYAPDLTASELPLTRKTLDAALARYGDLWAVISVKRFGIVGDDTGEMAQWLSGHCRQVDQFQRPRLDYRMYRVELWRCTDQL